MEIFPPANDEDMDNLIENYESDDDNAISLEKIKNETLGHTADRDESRPASRHSAPAPVTAAPQPPFQPSATPAHLEHRFVISSIFYIKKYTVLLVLGSLVIRSNGQPVAKCRKKGQSHTFSSEKL